MTAVPDAPSLQPDVLERWRRIDELGFAAAFAQGVLPRGPLSEHTGLRLSEVPGPGRLVFTWTPGPHLANGGGIVHGGYLAMVLDDAAGLAIATREDRFSPSLTTDLSVTYVRPGVIGAEHRVEGEVLHAGRSRLVADARVLGPDGALVATGRGSFVPNRAFGRPAMDAGS